MPDASCPHCDAWAPREAWTAAPGQAFPFRVVCPACGRDSDVQEIGYRLGASNPVLLTVRRYRGEQLLGVHFMYEFNVITGERQRG